MEASAYPIPPAPRTARWHAPDEPVTGPEPGELPLAERLPDESHRNRHKVPLPAKYRGQTYVERDGHLVRQQ